MKSHWFMVSSFTTECFSRISTSKTNDMNLQSNIKRKYHNVSRAPKCRKTIVTRTSFPCWNSDNVVNDMRTWFVHENAKRNSPIAADSHSQTLCSTSESLLSSISTLPHERVTLDWKEHRNYHPQTMTRVAFGDFPANSEKRKSREQSKNFHQSASEWKIHLHSGCRKFKNSSQMHPGCRCEPMMQSKDSELS